MTKIVDMDRVADGDKTTLKGTGINQSENLLRLTQKIYLKAL